MPPAAPQPAAPLPDATPPDAPRTLAREPAFIVFLDKLGAPPVRLLDYLGGVTKLLVLTGVWLIRSLLLRRVRFGRHALYSQIVRLGVRSVAVISLVSFCIGVILALQMAPPLQNFGQVDQVATIISIAVVRELGPLISAIVLTGFAGASIAAELGTMVVGEEIEAMEAHALNPVRFLVMPRVLATTGCLIILCIFAELIAIGGGWWIGVSILDIPSGVYKTNTIEILDLADFFTGLFKAGVFGMIIGAIACYNGLHVTGGAAGVGKATTNTVVHCIEAIIYSDLLFTAIFYVLDWT
jgi:phospholipid/cholesterol/gamma-HCH transport system permease protein